MPKSKSWSWTYELSKLLACEARLGLLKGLFSPVRRSESCSYYRTQSLNEVLSKRPPKLLLGSVSTALVAIFSQTRPWLAIAKMKSMDGGDHGGQ